MKRVRFVAAAAIMASSGCGAFDSTNTSSSSPDDDLEESPIVGGRAANEHAYPWMVAQFGEFGGQTAFIGCGGTLIDATHVITAAHCVVDGVYDAERHQNVVVPLEPGARKIALRPQSIKAVTPEDLLEVKSIRIHPEYKYFTQHVDVALIELSEPVRGITTMPQIVDERTLVRWTESEKRVRALGYGSLNTTTYELSDVLMRVDVPLVPQSECREAYGAAQSNIPPEEFIDESMVCGGFPAGGKDSCGGDSGGPLVAQADSWRPKLVGIVSQGYGCAEPGLPGIYGRPSRYVDWITGCVADATTCPTLAAGEVVCEFGYSDCDEQPETGCETDLLDPRNCGSCGSACESGEACVYDFQSGNAHCTPAKPLRPEIECVFEASDGTRIASFGYTNENDDTVRVEAGPNNRLTGVGDYVEDSQSFPGIREFRSGSFVHAPVLALTSTSASWTVVGPDGIRTTAEVTAATPACTEDPTLLPFEQPRSTTTTPEIPPRLLDGRQRRWATSHPSSP